MVIFQTREAARMLVWGRPLPLSPLVLVSCTNVAGHFSAAGPLSCKATEVDRQKHGLGLGLGIIDNLFCDLDPWLTAASCCLMLLQLCICLRTHIYV